MSLVSPLVTAVSVVEESIDQSANRTYTFVKSSIVCEVITEFMAMNDLLFVFIQQCMISYSF